MIFDPARLSYRQAARVLLPGARPDHPQPPGQRRRHELPLGDLLHQRRAEASRRGHDRRRERLGPVAGPGRHRAGAGRARSGRPSPSTRTICSGSRNGYTCHFVRPRWKLPVREAASCRSAPQPWRQSDGRARAAERRPGQGHRGARGAAPGARQRDRRCRARAAARPAAGQPSQRAAAAAPGVGAVPRRGRLDRAQPDHRSRGPARHHGFGAAVVQRPGGGARRQGPAVRRRQPACRLRRRNGARRRRRACRARRPRPARRSPAAGRADRAHPWPGRLPGAGRHPHRPCPARRRRRRRRHDPRLHRQHRRPARADGAAGKPAHQPGDMAPCARRVRLRGAAAAAGQGAGRAAAHLARAARQAARLSRRHPRHRRRRDAAGRARRRAGAAGRCVRGDPAHAQPSLRDPARRGGAGQEPPDPGAAAAPRGLFAAVLAAARPGAAQRHPAALRTAARRARLAAADRRWRQRRGRAPPSRRRAGAVPRRARRAAGRAARPARGHGLLGQPAHRRGPQGAAPAARSRIRCVRALRAGPVQRGGLAGRGDAARRPAVGRRCLARLAGAADGNDAAADAAGDGRAAGAARTPACLGREHVDPMRSQHWPHSAPSSARRSPAPCCSACPRPRRPCAR